MEHLCFPREPVVGQERTRPNGWFFTGLDQWFRFPSVLVLVRRQRPVKYLYWLYPKVYAFVNLRIDYCDVVLSGAPRTVTDKLQRVLNAAVSAIASAHRQPGSDTAWWTSLARRSWPGIFQGYSDSSPLSERPRTTIPVGALHPGLRCIPV